MNDAAPVVHLVGAGLGDTSSLTRRAAGLLRQADVVVLDRPSLDALAALAPPAAERVHVGRRPGQVAWATAGVVTLLVDRARRGRRVVRLKGGDPQVCSRGSEEALALIEAGVVVDVIPGVTAASAAGALSGLPRGRSITIVSGNHDPIGPAVDWAAIGALTDRGGAVVVLTGRSHQGAIAAGLREGGRDAANAVAVVHGAGRADCRVVPADLATVASVRLSPPAALVVGPTRPGGDHAHP